MKSRSIHIAINAQIKGAGVYGGVEQFVRGLVSALGRSDDETCSYSLVVDPDNPHWLDGHIGNNQRVVVAPPSQRFQLTQQDAATKCLQSYLKPWLAPARTVWHFAKRTMRIPLLAVPESNGFFENLGSDLVHFPFQTYIRCRIPTIYTPHDLQHLHHPEFFSDDSIQWRESVYLAGCRYSRLVVVESEWVKRDVVHQYRVSANKVVVIPWGMPKVGGQAELQTTASDLADRLGLPETFVLYPAQTWPHKNHLRLLDALKALRDEDGLVVNLVCTGRLNGYSPKIQERVARHGLERQVVFTGYVSEADLNALYKAAQFVVFPSLFEGLGLPLLEAFAAGTPVACSEVTCLPEYGGAAVLFFDPMSVSSIATAIRRMSTDHTLREELRRRGAARVQLFDSERMARAYIALFRHACGCALSSEHRALLAETLRPAHFRESAQGDLC